MRHNLLRSLFLAVALIGLVTYGGDIWNMSKTALIERDILVSVLSEENSEKNSQKDSEENTQQNISEYSSAKNTDTASTDLKSVPPAMPNAPKDISHKVPHEAPHTVPNLTSIPKADVSPKEDGATVTEPLHIAQDNFVQETAQIPDAIPTEVLLTEEEQVAHDANMVEIANTETADAETGSRIIAGTFAKGDTLGGLLGSYVDANTIERFIKNVKPVFSITAFQAEKPYTFVYDIQNKAITHFEYEINQHRKLVVDGESFNAKIEDIEYERQLVFLEGTITDNLFRTVADMGEQPQMALSIAKIFGWEVNFIRDIRQGDSFSILVEKLYRDGEFKAYGKTLGSTFTNVGKTYEAYLFYDISGKDSFYNLKGENLKKTLLQAPLSITRVTSGYTKSRKHPILNVYRPHLGIDYGAPTGTPVKAVGDGVVTKKGWVGGYGYQVIVRHDGGLESMYSHLSRFARGLKKGTKVRQGEVIAYVGSTGLSTGPHLDFRLRQNGKFINPATAINPRSGPVAKAHKKAYEERIALIRSFMQGTRPLTDYTASMIYPPRSVSDAGNR